jgi:hypothetical protein
MLVNRQRRRQNSDVAVMQRAMELKKKKKTGADER